MPPSEEEIRKQLVEYRKALRAMLWLSDSSHLLKDLLFNSTKLDPKEFLKWEKWEKDFADNEYPKITDDAFNRVIYGADWCICGYNKGYKLRKGSVIIYIYCFLDYYPKESAVDSLSVIEMKGYRITEGPSHSSKDWDALGNEFTEEAISKTNGTGFIPLEVHEDAYIPSGYDGTDIVGDYAYGRYDLARLTDPKAVEEVIFMPINELLEEWCG